MRKGTWGAGVWCQPHSLKNRRYSRLCGAARSSTLYPAIATRSPPPARLTAQAPQLALPYGRSHAPVFSHAPQARSLAHLCLDTPIGANPAPFGPLPRPLLV